MMMMNECKKHPQHTQQPGICSSCLTDKLTSILSNLSPPPHSSLMTKTSICNVSDLFSPNPNSYSHSSSTSSSTSMSPAAHRRHASTGGSAGFLINASSTDHDATTRSLKKSRSIAFVATSKGGRSGGFWKKLICSTVIKGSKRVFMHTRTGRVR